MEVRRANGEFFGKLIGVLGGGGTRAVEPDCEIDLPTVRPLGNAEREGMACNPLHRLPDG